MSSIIILYQMEIKKKNWNIWKIQFCGIMTLAFVPITWWIYSHLTTASPDPFQTTYRWLVYEQPSRRNVCMFKCHSVRTEEWETSEEVGWLSEHLQVWSVLPFCSLPTGPKEQKPFMKGRAVSVTSQWCHSVPLYH